jgi:hypothetical protein
MAYRHSLSIQANSHIFYHYHCCLANYAPLQVYQTAMAVSRKPVPCPISSQTPNLFAPSLLPKPSNKRQLNVCSASTVPFSIVVWSNSYSPPGAGAYPLPSCHGSAKDPHNVFCPTLVSPTLCPFQLQWMKLEPVVFWQIPHLLAHRPQRPQSQSPVRLAAVCVCMIKPFLTKDIVILHLKSVIYTYSTSQKFGQAYSFKDFSLFVLFPTL